MEYEGFTIGKDELRESLKKKVSGVMFYVKVNLKKPEILLINIDNDKTFSSIMFEDRQRRIPNNKFQRILYKYIIGDRCEYPTWRQWIRGFRQKHEWLLFNTTNNTIKRKIIGLNGIMSILDKNSIDYKESETERNILMSILHKHLSLRNQFIMHCGVCDFHPDSYFLSLGLKKEAFEIGNLWFDKYCKTKTVRETNKAREDFQKILDKKVMESVKFE